MCLMGSITDPTGAKTGNTGNGIAVYKFDDGKVIRERFLKIAPQKLAAGKKVSFGSRKHGCNCDPISRRTNRFTSKSGDRLLVANNLSDNVVLIDAADGHVVQQFDLSTHEIIPSSFPYTEIGCPRRTPRLVQPLEFFAGGGLDLGRER